MNPNPEIWGAPETWQNNFILGGITNAGAENLKASKAKVAKWDVEGWTIGTSQLRAAVLNNKITANQPIDKTICPCGQDIRASHLNQIGVFVNRNLEEYPDDTEVEYISLINGLGNGGAPLNWCFFETRRPGSGASAYFQNGYQLDMANTRYPYTVWEPGSIFDSSVSSKQNGNYYVAPLVSYQSRSILLRVVVDVIDTTYADGSPHDTDQITLEEWKNTYSNKKICRIALRMYKVYSLALSSITYNAPTIGIYDYSGAMILDSINVGQTNYALEESFQHFGFMGMGQTGYITLLPYLQNLSNQRQSNEYIYGFMPCMNLFQDAELKTVRCSTSDSHLGKVWQEIPYSDDTYDTIMSMAALFGCPFTPTTKLSFNNAFTDADLCLPIIDDNGITHGEYTRGSGNADNPFIELDNVRDKDYKPDADVDTNTYSNTTGFNFITEGAAMTVRYVLDGANVDKLLSDLWTINASIAQGGDFEYFDGKIKDEYLTTNPIDCIVSLIRYPFNIPYQIQPLKSYVKLGKTSGTAKGWTTVYISNQINFQGINIFPRFGNCFLDYEPYTTYELYVPFCGTTKIRAADILGHTLNVTMLIDLITGSCTAYVKADQLVIETLQGSCGVQQQISGADTATMNANIYNGILAQKQAKVGMIAQGASALLPSSWVNPVGYAAKGEQAEASYKQATFAIEHMETPVHSQGAASPLLGWIQEFDARLMIYYPEGDVIDGAIPPSFNPAPLSAYGHLKGFATVTPGTVGTFRSSNAAFLSGDIIVDAIPCTLSERNRIKSMFADGVYLPPL